MPRPVWQVLCSWVGAEDSQVLVPSALVRDLLRVGLVLPAIEFGRVNEGPGHLVPRLRSRGQASRRRNEAERTTLRRAIGIADRLIPGGPNCYRRALLEIALDAGAAEEPLKFGLRSNGGTGSGHAWLGSDRDPPVTYDVELAL